MDSLVQGLFDDANDAEQARGKAQDFVKRYEEGSPFEGVSDEETVKNYQRVAERISPQELEDSATEAFERFSPEQRAEFAGLLKQQGGDKFGNLDTDDPRELAKAMSQAQNQQENGMLGLLGGGSLDDIIGGLLGGGQRGGLGGMVSGLLGGGSSRSGGQESGLSGLLSNPMAKAALAGVAAMAIKKFL